MLDTSLSGARVARELDAIIARRGRPLRCVSDNGTELTSMVILMWCQGRQVGRHCIAPGKPQQNAMPIWQELGGVREALCRAVTALLDYRIRAPSLQEESVRSVSALRKNPVQSARLSGRSPAHFGTCYT